MIAVTDTISINENEIHLEHVRASGPGGQNVNKVASAVQLHFNAVGSASLPPDVKNRLIKISRRQISKEGFLIITARRFRTQEANRQDAMNRLIALISKAAEEPETRMKTRPTAASKRRRLELKRHRAETKRLRRPVSASDN